MHQISTLGAPKTPAHLTGARSFVLTQRAFDLNRRRVFRKFEPSTSGISCVKSPNGRYSLCRCHPIVARRALVGILAQPLIGQTASWLNHTKVGFPKEYHLHRRGLLSLLYVSDP